MARGVQVESLWSGVRDNSGAMLAGGKVYTYEAGTTTPKAVYTDVALTTPAANPVILDAYGRATVFASGPYKFVIHTSADVLVQTVDNLRYFVDDYPADTFVNATDYNGGTLTDETLQAAITAIGSDHRKLFVKAGTWVINASVTVPNNITLVPARGCDLAVASTYTLTINGDVEAGLYPIFSGSGTVTFGANSVKYAYPQWWSADGAGIQKAVTACRSVCVPRGTYSLSSEISIVNDFQRIVFEGATLNIAANSTTAIHLSASQCVLEGAFKISGAGYTGTSGIRVTPLDETQVTTRVDQNYNIITGFHITNVVEGIVLQCGPDIATADSGCWYNRIGLGHIQSVTRGIWLKDGPNASSAGCNRNFFYGIRIGQGTSLNSGVHIVSGDTNEFHNITFEGVAYLTSPISTATAVYVKATGAYSGDNNSNNFRGCHFEGCTTDIYNENGYTEFYGCDAQTVSVTANPLTMVGGYDTANTPLVLGGLNGVVLQSNSQFSGYQNAWNWLSDMVFHNKEAYDFISSTPYNWATYALTTSNCTNTTSISEYKSKYRRFNGMVEWHFRFRFRATTAGTVVRVTCPITPNSDLYSQNGTTPTMMWFTAADNGSSNSTCLTRFSDHSASPAYIEFAVPSAGNWNTAGNNNDIHCSVRYHV